MVGTFKFVFYHTCIFIICESTDLFHVVLHNYNKVVLNYEANHYFY